MSKFSVCLFLFPLLVQAQPNQAFDLYLIDLTSRFAIGQIDSDSLTENGVVLFDTREEEEYRVSHIKNAIYAGYDSFDPTITEGLPLDTEIIVYCAVGYRSSKIGERLIDRGFTNVKNLYGGIFKWVNEGRPLYKDTVETRTIHTYNKSWGRYITNPDVIKVE